eukprot:23691-Hanusia_phi.AAC.1
MGGSHARAAAGRSNMSAKGRRAAWPSDTHGCPTRIEVSNSSSNQRARNQQLLPAISVKVLTSCRTTSPTVRRATVDAAIFCYSRELPNCTGNGIPAVQSAVTRYTSCALRRPNGNTPQVISADPSAVHSDAPAVTVHR